MREVTGGTPYGASSITGAGAEARMPSALELDMCKYQGEHVTRITARPGRGTRGGEIARAVPYGGAPMTDQQRAPIKLPRLPARRRPARRSASTTTARNTWRSSTPATRSRRSPIAPPTSCARSARPRRHCGCSMRAWAMPRCSRASCAARTPPGPRCRNWWSPRKSAAKTCGSGLEKMADRFLEHPTTVLVDHQPALRRRARAAAAQCGGRDAPQLAGAEAQGRLVARVRAADRRPGRGARLRLGHATQRSQRQSRCTCGPRCW